nr:hypothetical protein [uncultured Enterobacter sp.]
MCQLRVRLQFADGSEELFDEVTHVAFGVENITLSRLFDTPCELYDFAIEEIDCMHNVMVLTQRTSGQGRRA